MTVDLDLLAAFERGLNPAQPEKSAIPAAVLGYGEISTVFRIGGQYELAFKRMPLFANRAQAEQYRVNYTEYCDGLEEAGLLLPETETAVVELPGRPVVLYIAQGLLPPESFAHRLIHSLDRRGFVQLLERIVARMQGVWEYNRSHFPALELALDGQISNWVWIEEQDRLYYVDTSTPLFRKNGVEQLDPELVLASAPSFLRWVLRLLFLEEVMTRYYDLRRVSTDLCANLLKEQRPELVAEAVAIVNRNLSAEPLSVEEVKRYYRGDKLLWSVFLSFRKIDRWLKTRMFGKRYEFILPAKIER